MVIEFNWVFFAVDAKPTSMRRALAERLAQRERVIIIDRGVSISRQRSIPSLRKRAIHLDGNENLIHYRPLHFPEKFPGVRRILKVLNEKMIEREMNHLLPERIDRIVCYDSPTQYPLVKKFHEKLSIYLAIDDRTVTVWGDPIPGEAEAESRLLGKVDLVICVSDLLAESLKSRVPRGANPPIMVLPNAYDERIFDPRRDYQEPGALMNVARPRILISGHISERIDWDGIIEASRLRPEWRWIFLGPADAGMKEKIQAALGGRGIWHPPVPVEEVPAWIRHCDACAVPYRLNAFTRASHPLKAMEYLAMGAPVLSTRIPSLAGYSERIEWVDESNGKSYAAALGKIVDGLENYELKGKRREAVAGDSWKVRVNKFREIVNLNPA